jgi:hypothetical protein
MSSMIRMAIGASILFLGEAALAQSTITNEYFPLKAKSKWTYKVQDQTVEVVVSGTEKFNNEECTKVDTLVNGKVVASELYAVKADGVYRVKVKDDKIEPPVKVLSTPAKKDLEWEIKSKVGNQSVSGKFKSKDTNEKVKVPAPPGEFDTILVEGLDMDIAGTKTTVKMWFAKEIGLVKLTYKIQDTESVLELTKYEGGDK